MFGQDNTTGRGFKVVAFADSHGKQCSLQQSSAVGNDDDAMDRPGTSFVWLGVDHVEPKVMKSQAAELGLSLPPGDVTGWMPYPLPEQVQLASRMHLTREQVVGLVERLTQWLSTGEFASADQSAEETAPADEQPAAEPAVVRIEDVLEFRAALQAIAKSETAYHTRFTRPQDRVLANKAYWRHDAISQALLLLDEMVLCKQPGGG